MGLVKLIVKFIYIEQPLFKRQVIFNGNDRQKNQKAENAAWAYAGRACRQM